MKKWFVIFCCLLLGLGNILTVSAEKNTVQESIEPITIKEGELYAQGAVLMDAGSGRVLYGKNQDMQLAMASTTKIMTCIVALEQGELEDVVTASGYAVTQPKVKLYLSKGDQVRLKDLLYSLMLESHNDSAVAIAEHVGAKILGWETGLESVKARTEAESKEAMKAFIGCMNEKAKELQCYQTWFITPNGLDGTEIFTAEDGTEIEKFHCTTAAELARIMSYCILQSPEKETFLKITGTYTHQFSDVEKTRSFVCRNHNAFLNMMSGAVSGKTGYTGRAGYCYVGALERDGRYFVVALLNTGAYGGANKSRKWQDTSKLMRYGLDYYKWREVYSGGTETKQVTVKNAKPNGKNYFVETRLETKVVDDKPVSMLLADWEQAEVVIEQVDCLDAPVRAGQIVGKVEVLLNGEIIKHYDIVCMEGVKEKTFADIIKYFVCEFLMG